MVFKIHISMYIKKIQYQIKQNFSLFKPIINLDFNSIFNN